MTPLHVEESRSELHTPGPWVPELPTPPGADISIVSYANVARVPRYIGRVYNSGIGLRSDPEAEENARVFANGPRMLKALRDIGGLAQMDNVNDVCELHAALSDIAEKVEQVLGAFSNRGRAT